LIHKERFFQLPLAVDSDKRVRTIAPLKIIINLWFASSVLDLLIQEKPLALAGLAY
jgi:hypothetical protein